MNRLFGLSFLFLCMAYIIFSLNSHRNEYFIKHSLTKSLCNDDSLAAYYYSSGAETQKWIINLEGGKWCWNKNSCRNSSWGRVYGSFDNQLISSSEYTYYKEHVGYLSNNPYFNTFYNWTRVNVKYCSSDIWSGSNSYDLQTGFTFQGYHIVQETISDLINRYQLDNATHIILAGNSAGGLGVMIHLDWIKEKFPDADVVGLNDGGWLLPLQFTSNNQPQREYFSQEIGPGSKLWKPHLPFPCLNSHQADPHYCYSATTLYRNLKTPLFIATNLLDGFVAYYANHIHQIKNPCDKLYWINSVINQTKESLSLTDSYFAPRCPSIHTFMGGGTPMITSNTWNNVKINGVSLRDAFDQWYFSQNRTFKLMEEGCSYQDPLCNSECPVWPNNLF